MSLSTKQQIRRSFNRATNSYERSSDWQEQVGDTLLAYLNPLAPKNKVILDLGSGTGRLARQIETKHPDNHLIAADIAENMLRHSQPTLQTQSLVCCDAETLPFASESVDIIISNMAIHWCHSLMNVLSETSRLLKPGGILIFSSMGSQSFQTFQKAWEQVDNYSHINSFPNQKIVKDACQKNILKIERFEQHNIEKEYQNVYELMRHLKETGVKNISTNKPRGLTGKEKIIQLNEYYQNPVNYEVFTLVCRK